MKKSYLRSLPVQSSLIAVLFLGSLVLGGIIVSQRWRFESFVKESYVLPRRELSDSTRKATDSLIRGESASEFWKRVPDTERRAVYIAWMQQGQVPTQTTVEPFVETDAEFFIKCSERTFVCGDLEQRKRGLTFIEMSGIDRAGKVLDRLAAWAERCNRPDDVALVEATRIRMRQKMIH